MTKLAHLRLDDVPFFPIPGQTRVLMGFAGVTGGGWIAGVSPRRGLYRLEDAEGPVDLISPPWLAEGDGKAGWVGQGAWGRFLIGGGEERGVLLDGLPVLVVQQRARSGAEHPITHLVISAQLSPAVVRSVTQGLLPRIASRLRRGAHLEGVDPLFSLTGWPASRRVAEARDVLVQLPLNPPDPDERAPAGGGGAWGGGGARGGGGGRGGTVQTPAQVAGLLGVDGAGGLHRLTDETAHEVALGALMAGEVDLAEQLLAPALMGTRTLSAPSPEDARVAAGRLLLAIGWATWTGRVERLRPLGPSLFAWVDVLEARAGVPLPSGLPSVDRLLDMLADALEPLGDAGAVRFLRERAEALKPLPAQPERRGGRQLPVLSAGGASPPTHASTPPVTSRPSVASRPSEAQLPPLEAFASPYHPSTQHRAAVHAARIVRSAVEGVLGVVPDAAWGRLRMAPDLTQVPPGDDDLRALTLDGLRVGDARVHLTCRAHATGCTLAVAQVGGRVPLNLVFEPRLPLARVDRVEMGGEAVQVQIQEDGAGIRMRLQFPLDPARSITVHGTSR